MKTVIITSTNPVKLQAAKMGFMQMYPSEELVYEQISVPSGVADQPMSDTEAFQGAVNRVSAAREQRPDADFYVGIEGGIEDTPQGMRSFSWTVIINRERRMGKGRTGTFFLPEKIAELIRNGHDLGEADDMVFGGENSKQKHGAIGILTGGVITRASLNAPAVVMALIPFKQPELYPVHHPLVIPRNNAGESATND